MAQKKAIVLLSGGLDSATVLALATSQGFTCYALTFDYAQRHHSELTAAKRIAESLGAVNHKIVSLSIVGASALLDHSIEVPTFDSQAGITNTYVPARNTIFLAHALSYAETLEAQDIFLGGCLSDQAGFPDCRPEYFAAFETMANLATQQSTEGAKLKIHTPCLYWTKAETIQRGIDLGVDYATTTTCYQADDQGRACGQCQSCVVRREGFKVAGVKDPTRYLG